MEEINPTAKGAVGVPTRGVPTPNPGVYRVSLPQKRLREFGGDVREWLTFWASFSVIHDDPSMPDAEKFEYLVQCLKPNSDAAKAIESFPIAPKNYQPAIETLKGRFGDQNMLITVYMRDLIQLAVENSTTNTKLSFQDLVAKLSSKIKNLEELGVNIKAQEIVLYPLLESCVPDSVLEAWQRSKDYKREIDKLMDFLRKEVQL